MKQSKQQHSHNLASVSKIACTGCADAHKLYSSVWSAIAVRQHPLSGMCVCMCRHLKMAGSAGLQVDPSKIVWTPYNAEREYASFRN